MTGAQENPRMPPPTVRPQAFTAFWLYHTTDRGQVACAADGADARAAIIAAFDHASSGVTLRAAYSTVGLTAGVDLILWVVAEEVEALQTLAVEISRSPAGPMLQAKHAYLGVASRSQYDPDHGPAFLKGIPPKKYFSVYPFTKTPDWFLLPYEERRDLMAEHGKMGAEFPSILTNTVNSFGIADQEFIVALEDDDPAVLVEMVQRLRAARVRLYTQSDTPIFLGLKKELAIALGDAI
jgi:hydrogen peroxide-dependent heme synthase